MAHNIDSIKTNELGMNGVPMKAFQKIEFNKKKYSLQVGRNIHFAMRHPVIKFKYFSK